MAVVSDNKHDFRVPLTKDAIKTLSDIVGELRVERGNYQMGVGTVAAELIEAIIDRPDLLAQLLGKDDDGSAKPKKRAA